MSILDWILKKARLLLGLRRSGKLLDSNAYISKRFPFLLCLLMVLSIGLTGMAQETINISLEGGVAAEFISAAKTNLYTLSAATIRYTTYPLMLRFKDLYLADPRVVAELTSGLTGNDGLPLDSSIIEWTQGSWLWEGRENEGPAPGLQFTAIVPILSRPGEYQAKILVNLYDGEELLSSFPVGLFLAVPRWAVCQHAPEIPKVRKRGTAQSGQVLLESDPIRLMVAANTNWSLWVNSPFFSAATLVATGGDTSKNPAGYSTKTYKIRELWQPPENDPVSSEAKLDLILKF